ncbi:interleukin-17B-like [Branchiostoma lanceolatum]|uniref:interleukin-17B-like n=1 Tax=Branchiostoma lanceolatum TaxID=7740 RepID=UPI0034556829
MRMRLAVVFVMVLVIVLVAGQEAHAKKRGKGRKTRPCRKEKNKQWCNKDKVEEMIKDHPAVDEEIIKKAQPGNTVQQSCPAGKIDLKDEDKRTVNERSLTPWVYVTNHSANRIPDTFVEARCLCEGCLIYGPDGVSVENTKDFENVPIKTGLPILERYDCKRRKCRERQSILQVTVGCMCATRKRATVPSS